MGSPESQHPQKPCKATGKPEKCHPRRLRPVGSYQIQTKAHMEGCESDRIPMWGLLQTLRAMVYEPPNQGP